MPIANAVPVGPLLHTILIHMLRAKETIEIVQRGIPGLAEFDPSRISFQKHVEVKGTTAGRWATILDEAWDQFSENPPSTLMVVVADEPGDKELRESITSEIDGSS